MSWWWIWVGLHVVLAACLTAYRMWKQRGKKSKSSLVVLMVCSTGRVLAVCHSWILSAPMAWLLWRSNRVAVPCQKLGRCRAAVADVLRTQLRNVFAVASIPVVGVWLAARYAKRCLRPHWFSAYLVSQVLEPGCMAPLLRACKLKPNGWDRAAMCRLALCEKSSDGHLLRELAFACLEWSPREVPSKLSNSTAVDLETAALCGAALLLSTSTNVFAQRRVSVSEQVLDPSFWRACFREIS